MGRWQDAADNVKPSRRNICGLQAFLDSLDAAERSEMEGIIARAMTIPNGQGRYTFIHDVIIAGGGPDLDPQMISKHVRKGDACPAS